MAIYVLVGEVGTIATTHLPSGDLQVSGPRVGQLEQVMFDICRWKGQTNNSYGGRWIIPKASAEAVEAALANRCTKIT